MASPGELIAAISEATGLPLPTVTDMDRRLTKAGLRSKGGRGLNAARMTAIDAARLLTAILASHQASSSVEAVTRYHQTRIDKARSSDKAFSNIGLTDLAALPARHGFVDALAALITSAAAGSLRQLIASPHVSMPQVDVFAFTRATRGRIKFDGLPDGQTASVEYIPWSDGAGRKRITTAEASLGDLEQSRRITARTILAIADLLRGEISDDQPST